MIKFAAILAGISVALLMSLLGADSDSVNGLRVLTGVIGGVLLPFYLLNTKERPAISRLPVMVCGALIIALLWLKSEQGVTFTIARSIAAITFIGSLLAIAHLEKQIRKNAE